MKIATGFFILLFLCLLPVACVRTPQPEASNTTAAPTANATVEPTVPAIQPPLPPGIPIQVGALKDVRVIGELSSVLTNYEKDTFAGLWIEYTPDYRIVVLFTSHGNETIARYLQGELQGWVEVRGAETSWAELRAIRDNTIKTIESFGIPTNSDVNVYENRVKVYVVDRALLDSLVRDHRLELSPKVDVVTVKSLATPATDV